MDALVYEDTPLATYFEGEAEPCDLLQQSTPPHTPFAPTGFPRFKDRLQTIRKSTPTVSPSSTEQLLEKFRYVIVASQLLSDEGGPRTAPTENDLLNISEVSVRGAGLSAALSFIAAWFLHWLRTRKRPLKVTSWLDVGIYSVTILLVSAGTALAAQQSFTRHNQKSAIRNLSRLIDCSHSLDAAANSAVRFIQEVEIVARGYELSTPLPPISRLEDRQTIRRCRSLRSELASTLKLLTILLVESHDAVHPYVNNTDLQRYYDIYEVSPTEFSQAADLVHNYSDEAQDSLKDLRLAIHLHTISRKVFLCDLLALRTSSGRQRFHQWRNIVRVLQEVTAEVSTRHHSLSEALSIQEWGTAEQERTRRKSLSASSHDGSEPASVSSNHTHLAKAQLRRFNAITNSVRALNAKAHLLKEEVSVLDASNAEGSVVQSALSRHYDALGAEIQSLLTEWEMGRNTMLLNVDIDTNPGSLRYSRSSSSIRSPNSPSPSMGGVVIVDGGPADALRLLSGDEYDHFSKRSTSAVLDEEVFEAVAARPQRKRMSMSAMTREEKMAKIREDRQKRATMHEQAETTTNMLRELRMVIKHRPRPSLGPERSPMAKEQTTRVSSL